MNPNGIVIGVVTDLEDPKNLGRVRVKYPHLNNRESQWARLVTPMAGGERGIFFRPEKGDEVLVSFLQGNSRFPHVIGSLWNLNGKPPMDDGKPKENSWRFIQSRSGHIIKLDDTSGKERIEILGYSQKQKIIIDCSGEKIELLCESGNLDLKAPSGTVTVEAQEINLKAKGNMSLDAKGQMTIKGSTVNIN